MGELSPWHWIVVLLIFGLLFGSRKLPDAARGLGRSMRIFKAELQGAREDNTPATAPATAAAGATASAPFATPTEPAAATSATSVGDSPADDAPAAEPFQSTLRVQDAVPVEDAVPPAQAGTPVTDR